MKIYLADSSLPNFTLASEGMASHHIQERIPRVLFSYHYIQDAPLDHLLEKYFTRPFPDVFLDSGAFSAYSQGAKINIAAYCRYIFKYKHLLAVYSNLDVIGSAEGTLKNQRYMESKGLQPLPVFH